MIRRQTIVWTYKWQLLISFHEQWSPVYLVPSGWRYQFDHSETPSQQRLTTGLSQLIWTVTPEGYANIGNLYIGKTAYWTVSQ